MASAARPQASPGRKAPAPCLLARKKSAIKSPRVVIAPKRGTFVKETCRHCHRQGQKRPARRTYYLSGRPGVLGRPNPHTEKVGTAAKRVVKIFFFMRISLMRINKTNCITLLRIVNGSSIFLKTFEI